jgi:hypothetical protein
MKYKIASLFSVLILISVICLGGSVNAGDEIGHLKSSNKLVDKIQSSIVKMLKPPTYEISIHAMLETGETRRIASTTIRKKGTPSEPEDVEAILLDKVIFIHEGDIYDITTPLHNEKGEPFAVTGIKVKLHEENVSKDTAKEIARNLSKKIEAKLLSLQ